MEITEVKVYPVRDKKLRAFASIVFDGSFMVNDIKVIEGKDGFFISMPSRRKKNGRFKDIAHPLNQETRQVMEDRIVSEYRRVAEGREEEQPVAETAADSSPASAAPPPSPVETHRRADAEEEEEEESSAGSSKSLEEVAEDHLSDSYWTT